MESPSLTAEGDCFRVVIDKMFAFMRGHTFVENLRVVHGTPVGTGGEVKGLRYWHAWIEFDVGGNGNFVVDGTIPDGDGVLISRSEYYRIGQIEYRRHTWKFTPEEAMREMINREHMGPWVDDWEDYEEV